MGTTANRVARGRESHDVRTPQGGSSISTSTTDFRRIACSVSTRRFQNVNVSSCARFVTRTEKRKIRSARPRIRISNPTDVRPERAISFGPWSFASLRSSRARVCAYGEWSVFDATARARAARKHNNTTLATRRHFLRAFSPRPCLVASSSVLTGKKNVSYTRVLPYARRFKRRLVPVWLLCPVASTRHRTCRLDARL